MPQLYHGPSPSIPLHAAYIWAEGQAIKVALAGTVITLPKLGQVISRHGKPYSKLEVALVRLLQQREATPAPTIGLDAEPTQAQVPDLSKAVLDAWMVEAKEKKAEAKAKAEAEAKAERQANAKRMLEEIGLL